MYVLKFLITLSLHLTHVPRTCNRACAITVQIRAYRFQRQSYLISLRDSPILSKYLEITRNGWSPFVNVSVDNYRSRDSHRRNSYPRERVVFEKRNVPSFTVKADSTSEETIAALFVDRLRLLTKRVILSLRRFSVVKQN